MCEISLILLLSAEKYYLILLKRTHLCISREVFVASFLLQLRTTSRTVSCTYAPKRRMACETWYSYLLNSSLRRTRIIVFNFDQGKAW